MNEVIKSLKERRSIRKYKPDMVPKELIDEVIEAGLYAANSRSDQTAIVIAVTQKEWRDKLEALNSKFTNGQAHPFYGAPVVLVVLAKTDRPAQYCDGCLVMGNLMQAAHSVGLGSCWIHRAKEVFETEEGKALLKELGIEGDYIGVGHCILGYMDGALPEAPARKENRVFYVK